MFEFDTFDTIADANEEIVRMHNDPNWQKKYGYRIKLRVEQTSNHKYRIKWVPTPERAW